MTSEQRSPSELSEEDQLVIQQARQRLIDFEIATDPHYEPNWHHEKIANELEFIAENGDREYKILIVTEPPRHGKTRECSIDFPAWYIGNNPRGEVICASYSAELSEGFGGKTRDKIDSPQYKAIFPNVRLKPDEKAKGRWGVERYDETARKWRSTGGGYTSAGVGGSITGRGANILFIDDPVKNREEAESKVMREKNWDWFTSTAFTRLEPGGVVVIIMTRWHMDDLVGRILNDPELAAMTKVMRFPALALKDGPHRKVGDPLWPERYDLEALEEIKTAVGPYDFAALYQCSPILTEKQEFKTEWYKGIGEDEIESKQTTNYLTIDTAMSKKAQADFCGFCDNAVDKEDFWNLKAWRAKIGPEELVDTIFALHARRHYSKIGIEKTAYTDGLKPFLDAEQRKRKMFLPIVEISHKGTAKEIRIRSLIPRYAAGSVRHIDGHCDDLEEEQSQFPNAMHDDVLDATAYQDQLITGSHNTGSVKSRRTSSTFSRYRK